MKKARKLRNFFTDLSKLDAIEVPYQTKSIADAKRVLIVDDDQDILESAKYIIEAYSNSTCDQVADAYEAMVALCDNHYDFILIDQKLPGISGSKLLKKIDRQIERDPLISESGRFRRKVPAMIMSGHNISLPKNYSLKHFDFCGFMHKRDLSRFLGERFAN